MQSVSKKFHASYCNFTIFFTWKSQVSSTLAIVWPFRTFTLIEGQATSLELLISLELSGSIKLFKLSDKFIKLSKLFWVLSLELFQALSWALSQALKLSSSLFGSVSLSSSFSLIHYTLQVTEPCTFPPSQCASLATSLQKSTEWCGQYTPT